MRGISMKLRASAVRENKELGPAKLSIGGELPNNTGNLVSFRRENSVLGPLDRGTGHPCSNCCKSPGSCGDEAVASMDGSVAKLR
jgi:hypothetical protein